MPLTYEIDCNEVASFNDFIQRFNQAFPSELGIIWNGNLDGFNDYLSWPEKKYRLRIKDSAVLKSALGYEATLDRLNSILLTCHPTNISSIEQRIADAKRNFGPTLYDEILEIIQRNEEFLEVLLE